MPAAIAHSLTPDEAGVYGGGLPHDHQPVGPEALAHIWLTHSNVKGWCCENWSYGRGPIFDLHYLLCDNLDTELTRITNSLAVQGDGAELARKIASSRTFEASMRQLVSSIEYYTTGDKVAAERMRLVRPPGGSIAPRWLADEANRHAKYAFQQQGRVQKGAGKGGQKGENPKGGGKGKKGGKAKGKAKPAA